MQEDAGNILAMARMQCAGDVRRMADLGARLIVADNAPRAPEAGHVLLEEALHKGNADAGFTLAILAAAGVARAQSWADGFRFLQDAAERGHRGARRERQILAAMSLTADNASAWIAAPAPRVLNAVPRFAAHAGLLPAALCKFVMEHARPRLTRAQVVDAASGQLKTDPMRTNTTAAVSLIHTGVVLQLIRARIANAAGVSPAQLEPLEVLHYEGGEQYRPHIDFFHPSRPIYETEMRLRGQRVKTCLVYLNSNYDGGETEFPKLNIRFRGEVGEALVFDNTTPDGSGDMNTLHAGLPPVNGVKWLLSQWIRERAQPVV
jgi:prolyl 4-hydroxylase